MMGVANTHTRIFFNELVQDSYSQKFRPTKYNRYTVVTFVFSLISCTGSGSMEAVGVIHGGIAT